MVFKKIDIDKVGKTPLIPFTGFKKVKNLFIKDESKNPYKTFKDRLAFKLTADINDLIKGLANQNLIKEGLLALSPRTFGVITLGNTSYPLGKYISEINSISKSLIDCEMYRLISFTYHDKDDRVIGPDTSGNTCKGVDIIHRLEETGFVKKLDLDAKFYDANALKEVAENEGWIIGDFQDITNGIELNGKQYPAYMEILMEIIEELGESPDYIIVPAGTGILYNEFCEYVIKYRLKSKIIGVTVTRPDSIADKLYGFYWQDIDKLERNGFCVTSYGKDHLMIRVDDNEIRAIIKELSDKIDAEPSGAAGFAALDKIKAFYPTFDLEKNRVVVVNTGNGIPNFIDENRSRRIYEQ